MQTQLGPSVLDQYLSIVKTFMLQTHHRISQQEEQPTIDPALIAIIDRATVKIKTQKQQIDILQQQLRQTQLAKLNYKEMKVQVLQLQKRLTQKTDQIGILRQTVKTLYQDNQRLSSQKEGMGREIASLKEGTSSLRKKIKKQEEDIVGQRNQLKKLASQTQDRLGEYAREEQLKQSTIKKLSSEVEKLRSQQIKKDKQLNTANKKAQQLKQLQVEHDKSVRLVQDLQTQTRLLLQQLDSTKVKALDQRGKLLRENQTYNRQLQQYRQLIDTMKIEQQSVRVRMLASEQKNTSYQNQIVNRTQKLKEKSKQIKLYSQQVGKLSRRIEQLSQMSQQIMEENREMSARNERLQRELEEVRAFQGYIHRLKGDISEKKSNQLNKLMEGLQKLQGHA